MIRRFLFYFLGVLIGLMAVLFFFGDREYRFPYLPNERVLFHLQEHPIAWSEMAECQWKLIDGDSLLLEEFLWDGDVDFGMSEQRRDDVKTYVVKHENRELWMVFQDLDTSSVILSLEGKRIISSDCD